MRLPCNRFSVMKSLFVSWIHLNDTDEGSQFTEITDDVSGRTVNRMCNTVRLSNSVELNPLDWVRLDSIKFDSFVNPPNWQKSSLFDICSITEPHRIQSMDCMD